MSTTKKPYVKHYDRNGNVSNPITKDKPYLHESNDSRQLRRGHHRIIHIPIMDQVFSFLQRRTSNGNWIKI